MGEKDKFRITSNEDPIKALYSTSEFQSQNAMVHQNATMKEMLKQRDDTKRVICIFYNCSLSLKTPSLFVHSVFEQNLPK